MVSDVILHASPLAVGAASAVNCGHKQISALLYIFRGILSASVCFQFGEIDANFYRPRGLMGNEHLSMIRYTAVVCELSTRTNVLALFSPCLVADSCQRI